MPLNFQNFDLDKPFFFIPCLRCFIMLTKKQTNIVLSGNIRFLRPKSSWTGKGPKPELLDFPQVPLYAEYLEVPIVFTSQDCSADQALTWAEAT